MAVLIAECIIFTVNTNKFASVENFLNVLRQISMTGIVSVGSAFVMISGGIDLSVGSIVAMSLISTSFMLIAGVPPVIACILAILLAIAIGAINGLLVAHFKIPPLIATLGMQTVVRGIVYIMTNATPVFGFPDSFRVLGQGYAFVYIPIPVLILAAVIIVAWIYINKTTLGRYTYAVGGNEEVARLSGIGVKKVKYITYMICSFCCGLAGVILLSRLNSGQPRAGLGYEMDAITAVVLGGVSVSGGKGRLSGVLIGVMIMGILSNGMIMMGINEYWQLLLRGLVLLVAVGFDIMAGTRKAKIVLE